MHEVVLDCYDGSSFDSLTTTSQISHAIGELNNMRLSGKPLVINEDTLYAHLGNTSIININDIILFNFNYNNFDTSAFANNLIDTLDGCFIDVFPRFKSPYLTDKYIFAAPHYSTLGYENPYFRFKKEFFYNNKYIDSIILKVDFGDGQGFQVIQWDYLYKPTYKNSGNYVLKLIMATSDIEKPNDFDTVYAATT